MERSIQFSVAADQPEPELPDMAKQIHDYAQDDTPSSVTVPGSYAGILMWAFGKHGPIVLFVISTWLLYNDNKANQAQIYKDSRETGAQLMEVARAQITVNGQVAASLSEMKSAIVLLTDEARRAHHTQ